MATEAEPIPGNWYLNTRSRERFQVVALDDAEANVEIQRYNGDLDQIPLSEWYRLNLRPSEPSIEESAVFSDMDDAALNYTEDDPDAAQVPSDEEKYRRRNVEYAGKADPRFPDPRPERTNAPELGTERGTDQWPESRQ